MQSVFLASFLEKNRKRKKNKQQIKLKVTRARPACAMARFVRGALFLFLTVAYVHAKGDIGDFEHHEKAEVTAARASAYYTEMMVQGVGKEPQACSERVLASRRAAVANGKKVSIGVEPTVGLGAALLIFLGVGVFAVVIAQTFQMVS